MSRLVALYPRTWRDRYGAELEDLLAARPPTLRDRVDVLRGSLDARLHPQLASARRPRYPTREDRAIGLATVASGLLLSVWGIGAGLLAPRWESNDPISPHIDTISRAGVIGMYGILAIVAIVVIRYGQVMRPPDLLGALVMGIGLLGASAGGGLVTLVLLLGGTLAFAPTLATRIAGRAAGLALAGGTIAGVAGFLLFAASNGQEVRLLWLLAAYGAGWVTVGLGFVRGSLTQLVSVESGATA